MNLLTMIRKTAIQALVLSSYCGFSAIGSAQYSVNASGGDFEGAGGIVSFSIGQVFYATSSGVGGSTAEGVQQIFQITENAVEEVMQGIEVQIFPNPTAGELRIQTKVTNECTMSYRVSDMAGLDLRSGLLDGESTTVSMSDLPSACYILNLVDCQNQQVRSYRVVKN